MLARQKCLALALAALCSIACAEHADLSLTPAQKKKVEAAVVTAAEAKPQKTTDAVIEDQVRLIGYDLDRTEVAAGETVTITYYLEALAEPMGDNMIFVHLEGNRSDKRAWMNLDHHPVEGLMPLRQLKKGQVVKDTQRIVIKPDFPGGEAKIYWGLWRGETRLKITNADKVGHDKEGRVHVATLTVKGGAKSAALPTATAMRLPAGQSLKVDGKLDEAAWQQAPYTEAFVSPSGSADTAGLQKTRARFLWDDTALYVAVESSDTDIWSTFTERDSNTWEQEVIELFLDPDGDKNDYLELQVTPSNVVFDAKFVTHRSDLAVARAWNMAGFKSAVSVDGTVNARDDLDVGYVVELAVPFAETPSLKNTPPKSGDEWRVNLFRWDAPKGGKQIAQAFSPPVVPDFHALDRFGRLKFVDPSAAPSLTSAALSLPVGAPSLPVAPTSSPAVVK